jgi:hypothetical protein
MVAAVTILAVVVAQPVAAAGRIHIFAAKFVCGFTDGRVVRLNDPTPLPTAYRAVEPGNYATVVNVANLTFDDGPKTVERRLISEGFTTVALPDVNLPEFELSTVDCDDLGAALAPQGFANDGRFFEGYLVTWVDELDFSENAPPLEVTAAYSYAVQNGRPADQSLGLGSSVDVERIEPRVFNVPE